MLLKLLSGNLPLEFSRRFCWKTLHLCDLSKDFCVTKQSSEAVRYGGHVCICAQQSSCQNWEMLENHALLSWTKQRILTAPEMCKEGDIENGKMERTAGFNFFFFFFLAHVWRWEIDNPWFLQIFFFLLLHLNIEFSSAWKGNYVGRHVL